MTGDYKYSLGDPKWGFFKLFEMILQYQTQCQRSVIQQLLKYFVLCFLNKELTKKKKCSNFSIYLFTYLQLKCFNKSIALLLLFNCSSPCIAWFPLQKVIQPKACVSTLAPQLYRLLIVTFKDHWAPRKLFVLEIN